MRDRCAQIFFTACHRFQRRVSALRANFSRAVHAHDATRIARRVHGNILHGSEDHLRRGPYTNPWTTAAVYSLAVVDPGAESRRRDYPTRTSPGRSKSLYKPRSGCPVPARAHRSRTAQRFRPERSRDARHALTESSAARSRGRASAVGSGRYLIICATERRAVGARASAAKADPKGAERTRQK